MTTTHRRGNFEKHPYMKISQVEELSSGELQRTARWQEGLVVLFKGKYASVQGLRYATSTLHLHKVTAGWPVPQSYPLCLCSVSLYLSGTANTMPALLRKYTSPRAAAGWVARPAVTDRLGWFKGEPKEHPSLFWRPKGHPTFFGCSIFRPAEVGLLTASLAEPGCGARRQPRERCLPVGSFTRAELVPFLVCQFGRMKL